MQFELTFKFVGQPLVGFILRYYCAVCICKFRCFVLTRISTRQEMKDWKDGNGLRKENSVDVKNIK